MCNNGRFAQSKQLLAAVTAFFSSTILGAAYAQPKENAGQTPNCVITGGNNNSNNCPTNNRYYVRDPNRGQLVPASKQLLESPCNVTKPSLNVFMGSNVYVYPIIPDYIFQTPEGPSVGVRAKNKKLFVNLLQVFDDKGQNVVHFDEKGYWVLPTARLERPDRSTLEVYDYHDRLIFSMRFHNPNTIQIMGVFHQGENTVTVNPDSTVIKNNDPSTGSLTIGRSCFIL